jgi:superfamily II DNA helicase RecQ
MVDETLEQYKKEFYQDISLRALQGQVYKEIVRDRNANGNSPCTKRTRDDVFFTARCGYGKTLCFVLASQFLKGITVSGAMPLVSN